MNHPNPISRRRSNIVVTMVVWAFAVFVITFQQWEPSVFQNEDYLTIVYPAWLKVCITLGTVGVLVLAAFRSTQWRKFLFFKRWNRGVLPGLFGLIVLVFVLPVCWFHRVEIHPERVVIQGSSFLPWDNRELPLAEVERFVITRSREYSAGNHYRGFTSGSGKGRFVAVGASKPMNFDRCILRVVHSDGSVDSLSVNKLIKESIPFLYRFAQEREIPFSGEGYLGSLRY